jgi:hypothetical protein
MYYFYINDVNYSHLVSGLKVGYETLVGDNSGRNANGDTVIDIINRKHKLYVTFRHTTNAEMQSLLNSIADYVVTVKFLNPKTQEFTTITTYTGTPEPEYLTISDKTVFKPMNLNFIEL